MPGLLEFYQDRLLGTYIDLSRMCVNLLYPVAIHVLASGLRNDLFVPGSLSRILSRPASGKLYRPAAHVREPVVSCRNPCLGVGSSQ